MSCAAADCESATKVIEERTRLEMEFGASRRGLREASRLAARRLGGVHGELWYLSTFWEGRGEDVIAAYEARVRVRQADFESRLLSAASRIGTDTARAERELRAMLLERPSEALPHLLLAQIEGFPKFRPAADGKEAPGRHAVEYLRRCPDYFPLYRYVVPRPERRELAGVLRGLIAGKVTDSALRMWPTLWLLEGNAKEIVARDVVFLEGLDRKRYRELEGLLPVANRLLGREATQREVAGGGVRAAMREWELRNPRPAKGGPTLDEYYRRRLAAADEWMMMEPESAAGIHARWNALRMLPETTREQIEECAAALQASFLSEEDGFYSTPPKMSLAEERLKRGWDKDEVPGLVALGLEDWKRRQVRAISDVGDTSRQVAFEAVREVGVEQYGAMILFDFSIDRGDTPGAALQLMKMEALAARIEAIPNVEPMSAFSYRRMVLWRRGILAEKEGRLEAAAAARKEYAELRAPQGAVARVSEWEGKRLPVLEGEDGAGKPVRLEWGKPRVVHLWATWCGPCVAELPEVLRLVNSLRDEPRVEFLSLNVDAAPGTAREFLRERAFALAPVYAYPYAMRVIPQMGIPRIWIVDEEGMVRKEWIGYDNKADLVKQVRGALQELWSVRVRNPQ